MRKYALVAGGVLVSVVLGATVFSTPLAWAAQAGPDPRRSWPALG
jgi:hypothetical protein